MNNNDNWDLEKANISEDKIEKNLKDARRLIENDIDSILQIIDNYDPLLILKLTAIYVDEIVKKNKGRKDIQSSIYGLMRFLIKWVASNPNGFSNNKDILSLDKTKLKKIYNQLETHTLKYLDNLILNQVNEGSFRNPIQIILHNYIKPLPIEYKNLNNKILEYKCLLFPFSDEISKNFDSDLEGLLEAAKALTYSGFKSMDLLEEEIEIFAGKTQKQMKEQRELGNKIPDKALLEQIILKNNWQQWFDNIKDKSEGFDLFLANKLTKLSQHDIDLLSVSEGSIFSNDPFWLTESAGLDDSIFIKIRNKSFIFDGEFAIDRIYAAIKKVVLNNNPDYREYWESNEKRKNAMLPFSIFAGVFSKLGYTLSYKYKETIFTTYFEKQDQKVFLQVPSAHGYVIPLNPIKELVLLENAIRCYKSSTKSFTEISDPIILITNDERKDDITIKDNVYEVKLSYVVTLMNDFGLISEFKKILFKLDSVKEEEHHPERDENKINIEDTQIKTEEIIELCDIENTFDDDDVMGDSEKASKPGQIESDNFDDEESIIEKVFDLEDDYRMEEFSQPDLGYDEESIIEKVFDLDEEEFFDDDLSSYTRNGLIEDPIFYREVVDSIESNFSNIEYSGETKEEIFQGEASPIKDYEELTDLDNLSTEIDEDDFDVDDLMDEMAFEEIEAEREAQERASQNNNFSFFDLLNNVASGKEPLSKPNISELDEVDLLEEEIEEPVIEQEPNEIKSTKSFSFFDVLNNVAKGKDPLSSQILDETESEIANKELEKAELAEDEAEKDEAEKVELEKAKLEKVEAEKVEAEKVELEKAKAEKAKAEKANAYANAKRPDNNKFSKSLLASVVNELNKIDQDESDLDTYGTYVEDEEPISNVKVKTVQEQMDKEVIQVNLKEYKALEENRVFETEIPSIGATWPKRVYEIVKFVDDEDSSFFDICKNADFELLEGIDHLIDKALAKQKTDNKEKMFTIPGYNLTIVLATDHSDKLKLWERKTTLGAVMYSQSKETWNALILKFAKNDNLSNVEQVELNKNSFEAVDWKFVVSTGNRLKKG